MVFNAKTRTVTLRLAPTKARLPFRNIFVSNCKDKALNDTLKLANASILFLVVSTLKHLLKINSTDKTAFN